VVISHEIKTLNLPNHFILTSWRSLYFCFLSNKFNENLHGNELQTTVLQLSPMSLTRRSIFAKQTNRCGASALFLGVKSQC
jgi:hypothetical protein